MKYMFVVFKIKIDFIDVQFINSKMHPFKL